MSYVYHTYQWTELLCEMKGWLPIEDYKDNLQVYRELWAIFIVKSLFSCHISLESLAVIYEKGNK